MQRTLALVALCGVSASAAASGPSAYFNQELATTARDGEANFDLVNGGNHQLRVGMMDGEVILNIGNSTLQ